MYIGIDIGGTKTAVLLGNEKGEITRKIKFCTTGREDTLKDILNAADCLMNEQVKAVGISCGGPMDVERGMILSPPNLPGWDEVEIVRMIEEQVKRPAYLQNDADAGALAEWYFGNAKGYRHIVFLTFGTGFGAGLILNGSLYTGAGSGAGEIGHVRLYPDGHTGYGKKGSVEGYCSGGGIEQYQMGTARAAAERAYAGDAAAIKLFEEIGENLGRSLAILTDILNPEIIIIGSIYTRTERLMKDSMLRTLRDEATQNNYRNVTVMPSKLGESIGDTAALCVAVNGYNSKRI